MKYRRISLPEVFCFVAISSMLLPGTTKSYDMIMTMGIIYLIYNIRKLHNKSIILYMVVIILYSIYRYINGTSTPDVFTVAFAWMNLFVGIGMQVINQEQKVSADRLEKMHISTISIFYVALIITITQRIIILEKFSIGLVLHNSLLALIGTILAIELLRRYNNVSTKILAIVLITLPIIGTLRQYVYIIIPMMFLLTTNKSNIKVIVGVIFIIIIFYATDVGSMVQHEFANTTKANSMSQFLGDASSVEESTFETRLQWWVTSAKETISRNIIFGHMLSYHFKPFGYSTSPSGMLHSQFASSFADGGIVLFLLVAGVYVRSFKHALKKRNKYDVMAIYTYIIVMGMNGWALTQQNALIAFYILGYYVARPTMPRNLKIEGK